MSDNQNQYIHGHARGDNIQQHQRSDIQQQQRNAYPSYPGRPNFGPGGAPYGSQLPAIIPQQSIVPVPPPAQAGGGGLGGLFSNLNLGNFKLQDIKGIIDRMGGVEGVVSTMGKVQKIMSSVQQMQPMIKLLLGSFSKAKNGSNSDDYIPSRRRRRKRRRRSSRTVNSKKRTRR